MERALEREFAAWRSKHAIRAWRTKHAIRAWRTKHAIRAWKPVCVEGGEPAHSLSVCHCPRIQIDSEDNVPFMFGNAGCGHITQCPAHPQVLAFGWAYA